jgi:hypothetical protein
MSVEIRYTFVGYKVTDEAVKHQIKHVQDITRITEGLYGDTSDSTICLIIDSRFIASMPKKPLQQASDALLNLLDVAEHTDHDVLLVVRRTLANDIAPKAGMIDKISEYISDNEIRTVHPYVRIDRKPVGFVNNAVIKRADDVTYVTGEYPLNLPASGVEINPLLVCPCPALLGDLHPMESSDTVEQNGLRIYSFQDAAKRLWSVATKVQTVNYDEAMEFIKDTPLLKRHLDMFYDSTMEPVKPTKEVLNMLLPWGLVVAE